MRPLLPGEGDARGQLLTITQPGRAITTLTYDGRGNVRTSQQPATAGLTTLGYDAAGHLATMTDALNHTRTMEVTPRGEVPAVVDAVGHGSEVTQRLPLQTAGE